MKILFESKSGKKVEKTFNTLTEAKTFVLKNKKAIKEAQIMDELKDLTSFFKENAILLGSVIIAAYGISSYDYNKRNDMNDLVNRCQVESAVADEEKNVINVYCKLPFDMEANKHYNAKAGKSRMSNFVTAQKIYTTGNSAGNINGFNTINSNISEYNIRINYNDELDGSKKPVSIEIRPNNKYSAGSKTKIAKLKEHSKIYNVIEEILEDGVR